jgi:hypothetical protein
VTNLSETSEPAEIPQEAPVVDGTSEAGIEATTTEDPVVDAPVAEEEDLLDTSEIGDRKVKLTVDGEEVVVPLNEALSGYNRASVATKRFQEASRIKEEAEDALRLAKAVQNNPGLTMQVLAQQAGLTVEQFLNLSPQQQQNIAELSEPEPTFDDPLERQLYEERQARIALEQRIEAQEQSWQAQQADIALRQAVGNLQNQLGATPEDARAVVQQALDMHVGPEFFPMIYQAQQYQKTQVQTEATTAVEAAKAAEEAARQQAAAQAGQAVGTGTGAVGTAPPEVVRPMTAEEAIVATLDQLGVA